jgi:hypothetical protein
MLKAFQMNKCVKLKIIMGQDRAVGLIFEDENKGKMVQFLSQFQFTLIASYL